MDKSSHVDYLHLTFEESTSTWLDEGAENFYKGFELENTLREIDFLKEQIQDFENGKLSTNISFYKQRLAALSTYVHSRIELDTGVVNLKGVLKKFQSLDIYQIDKLFHDMSYAIDLIVPQMDIMSNYDSEIFLRSMLKSVEEIELKFNGNGFALPHLNPNVINGLTNAFKTLYNIKLTNFGFINSDKRTVRPFEVISDKIFDLVLNEGFLGSILTKLSDLTSDELSSLNIIEIGTLIERLDSSIMYPPNGMGLKCMEQFNNIQRKLRSLKLAVAES